MLGRHHLSLSVGTAALVFLPIFPVFPLISILALVGTAIGSLIPDADSPDAAIFHTEVRGMGDGVNDLLNATAPLYPIFGKVTKYLIYKPAVRFYDEVVFDEYEIAERHRGFLHSFLGLGTILVLTALYMTPILFFLDMIWTGGLAVFLGAYFGGAILHLVEDSCTKRGIQWIFPFQSWRLKGQIRTTADPSDMQYQRGFLSVLGLSGSALFLLPLMVTQYPPYWFSIGGLVLGVLLWLVFTIGFAKVRISRD